MKNIKKNNSKRLKSKLTLMSNQKIKMSNEFIKTSNEKNKIV